MRRTLALVAPLLGLTVPAAGQQVAVRLDEAVRRALEVQPAMVQARGDLRNASAAERSAAGAFLPTVSVSASANRQSGSAFNPVTNQIFPDTVSTTYSGGVSLNLDLFNGFRRFAVRRAAAASRDAADAALIAQRFQIALTTKEAFYNALARDELVRVAEVQVRRAEQQLQIAVQKLRAGSATRSDSLRATVDLGNQRLALSQAHADRATAQAQLGRQIGVEGAVRAIPDSGFPGFPDTTGVRGAALAAAPEVAQADAQARAAAAQVGAARSQYWPTFSASYGTSLSGRGIAPWNSLSSYTNNNALRFTLSWTVFNGFAREANQVAASVQRDLADARAAEARRAVDAQLTQQLAALVTAYEQIEIGRANVAAAAEDLRVQQERYRVGAATILDLLTSQASLAQAEVNLVQARFNAQLARAELEALVGRQL